MVTAYCGDQETRARQTAWAKLSRSGVLDPIVEYLLLSTVFGEIYDVRWILSKVR